MKKKKIFTEKNKIFVKIIHIFFLKINIFFSNSFVTFEQPYGVKDNVKKCLRTNGVLFGICLDYLKLMLFKLLFRKTVKSNFLEPPASTKFSGFRGESVATWIYNTIFVL